MKKKIVWEKYQDPLLSNLHETEWPGFDHDEDDDVVPYHSVEKQPVMQTPMGMLSVVDHTFATSQFDFWMMFTNFPITDGVVEIIDQVPGVETFERYTKYRARVGFPRSGLFQPRDVMNDIKANILAAGFEEQNEVLVGLEMETAKKVINVRANLADRYDSWAIWVVPNGNLEVLGADNVDAEYMKKLTLLKRAVNTVGGRLLISSESD